MISSYPSTLSLAFSYVSSLADASGWDVARERDHRNRVDDEDQRKPKSPTSKSVSEGPTWQDVIAEAALSLVPTRGGWGFR